MKRLIFSLIILVFLAMTFHSTVPPGWYAQSIPVFDEIRDIQFVDSLTGWLITTGSRPTNDTGYILKTTNGGDNWQIQFRQTIDLHKIEMIDNNTGYVGGGLGAWATRYMFKTTNGGVSWDTILGTFATGGRIEDISFINRDTGWYADVDVFDGGLFKTTNGGVNWQRQRNPNQAPTLVQFINSNTGWMVYGQQIWKSTNGGDNWFFQVNSLSSTIRSIFFLDENKGWAGGLLSLNTTAHIMYTTNSGLNWYASDGVKNINGGYDIFFVNDSVGWAGTYQVPYIMKTTNGGVFWGVQKLPYTSTNIVSAIRGDTSHAWSNRSHTSDGGGAIIYTGIENITSTVPSEYDLYQNYPNPFNPVTRIRFSLPQKSFTKLIISDISGKIVSVLVNQELQSGEYEYTFDAINLSSGIYFYTMITEKYKQTKKLILLK